MWLYFTRKFEIKKSFFLQMSLSSKTDNVTSSSSARQCQQILPSNAETTKKAMPWTYGNLIELWWQYVQENFQTGKTSNSLRQKTQSSNSIAPKTSKAGNNKIQNYRSWLLKKMTLVAKSILLQRKEWKRNILKRGQHPPVAYKGSSSPGGNRLVAARASALLLLYDSCSCDR